MKKEMYLMILEKAKDSYRIEPVLKFEGIKFERKSPDQYYIWVTERQAVKLHDTFDYVAVIKCE